jgi:hypothetical protein
MDLRVMSPTSYQTALPRVACVLSAIPRFVSLVQYSALISELQLIILTGCRYAKAHSAWKA